MTTLGIVLSIIAAVQVYLTIGSYFSVRFHRYFRPEEDYWAGPWALLVVLWPLGAPMSLGTIVAHKVVTKPALPRAEVVSDD